ncbi:hypothetical protein M153_2790009089 [Pseudoloma neurophilia]|uniref:Diphthamide biosynthesis protein 3 n=1 Tax=Pseudoloma neurophilia TaxID=146866 RepID=A0A0R0LYJ0_9MICR|nr:hypothetical protein M153_2790009089 [Pseudoloma neurophilia]
MVKGEHTIVFFSHLFSDCVNIFSEKFVLLKKHPFVNKMASFQNKVFSAEELMKMYSVEEIFYNEVELEEMKYNKTDRTFTYPCPCGDKFVIDLDDLLIGEIKATCPSCSLIIKVSYDMREVEKYLEE